MIVKGSDGSIIEELQGISKYYKSLPNIANAKVYNINYLDQ